MLTEKELETLKARLFVLANNPDLGTAISATQVLARLAEVERKKESEEV